MALWQVALDESGLLDDLTQRVILAGVVVRGAADARQDVSLRRALEQVYDGVPYPMHATHLRLPTAHVVYRLSGVKASEETTRACSRAVAAVTRAASGPLWQLHHEAAALAHGHGARASRLEVPRHVLECADAWLADHDADAYADLERHMDRQDASMRKLVSQLAGEGRAFLVVAQDGPSDPATSASANATERWLTLFDALALRVQDVLRSGEVSDHAFYHLASFRGVTRTDVLRVLSRPLAPSWAGGASWHALARSPAPYLEAVSPWVVVADWLANRTRPLLRGELKEAAARITRLTGLPLHMVPAGAPHLGPLPTCTATGTAHSRVLSARTPLPGPDWPADDRRPRWITEQSDLWVDALTRGAR